MIEAVLANKEKILPTVMIVLSVGAAIVYGSKGDTGRMLYWLFGAGIASTITFLVR